VQTERADIFSVDNDSVCSVGTEFMQTVPAENVSAVSSDKVSVDLVQTVLVETVLVKR